MAFDCRTRRTSDKDIPKLRAMAAGLRPALNDARHLAFGDANGLLISWLDRLLCYRLSTAALDFVIDGGVRRERR
jgi:hypothetical protein